MVALVFISGCAETISGPCPGFHPASQDKDMCLVDYAEQHKDPKICETINSEIYKDECHHDVAVLTNDIELCKKIVGKLGYSIINLCFKTIAVNLTDETICEYLIEKKNYTSAKDGCYLDIAGLTKDKTICEKIINENWRKDCIRDIRFPECEGKDYCFRGYAKQYEDTSICEFIESEFSREMCKNDVAVLTNDIELCKIIGMSPIKDDCLKTIAVNLTDETICEYISDTGKPLPQSQYTYKDECYNEIAKLAENKTICNKITSEELREECMSSD